MYNTVLNRARNLPGLIVALLIGLSSLLQAGDTKSHAPRKTAVTGGFDWSIVQPNLPAYVTTGTDGDLYLRNMTLVGVFNLSGSSISLSAKIGVQLSGDLDAAGTGALWGPVTITATIDGVRTLIFEGPGTANTVNLVSVGHMTLKGCGPYEGTTLEFIFEEIGPGNSDTYTFKGHLTPSLH